MTTADVTNFLHSRYCAVLAVIVAVVAVTAAYQFGGVEQIEGSRGVILSSPNMWISVPVISYLLNLVAVLGLAFVCEAINKGFNPMRAQTALWATFFILFTVALPELASQFNSGTLLCGAMMFNTVLLFSCFADVDSTRRIFIMFFGLSLLALVQYAALFYVPLLVLGLVQMRVFSLRSSIAALLGLLAPHWILFGCGLLSFDDIHWPEMVNLFSVLSIKEMALAIVVVAFAAVAAVVTLSLNLIKTISYNAKCRAYNGFLAIMTIATLLLIIVDFNNLATYVTLLNFLAAYQVAHAFSNHRTPRSCYGILAIILALIAIASFGII